MLLLLLLLPTPAGAGAGDLAPCFAITQFTSHLSYHTIFFAAAHPCRRRRRLCGASRSGGLNLLVATNIGSEGIDSKINICFATNLCRPKQLWCRASAVAS
jgi:hypothetical protein